MKHLIYSSEFHKAAFEVQNLMNVDDSTVNQIMIGSSNHVHVKIYTLARIFILFFQPNTKIYAPNSSCLTTMMILTLALMLGRKEKVELIRDGYKITSPLPNVFRLRFNEPTNVEQILAKAVQKHQEKITRVDNKKLILVSIKKPSNKFNQKHLPEMYRPLFLWIRSFHEQDINLAGDKAVICLTFHRSIEENTKTMIIDMAHDIARTYGPCEFQTSSYSSIDLEKIIAVYTFSSTIIWEIKKANHAAKIGVMKFYKCRNIILRNTKRAEAAMNQWPKCNDFFEDFREEAQHSYKVFQGWVSIRLNEHLDLSSASSGVR